MQRFYIYLTDEQQQKIEQLATISKKPKAEVVRQALDKGLVQARSAGSLSARALLKFANQAKALPTVGKVPEDFIENLDYYTWGGSKDE